MLVERKIDYVNEQITSENVYDIAKMAALIATKNYIKFASRPVLKMFGKLVEDIAQMNCVNRTFSDSFDFVQVAALFLLENKGRVLGDTYKISNRGRKISIFEMTLRFVSREIGRTLRINHRKVDESELETVVDITNESTITTEESYDKVEKIIDSLNLNETQRTALECRMSGYSYPQTAKMISRALATTYEMMQKIRAKYINSNQKTC